MTYEVEAFIEEKMREGKEGTLQQLIDEEREKRGRKRDANSNTRLH